VFINLQKIYDNIISHYNNLMVIIKLKKDEGKRRIKLKKDVELDEGRPRVGRQFQYYPTLDDPNFYEIIYYKKEFNKNRIPRESKTTNEICNARYFTLAPQQEFLRNYISIDTPYNGILIYHGTGVGKTCSAIQIGEGFKEVLRRMHSDDKRKITVALSRRILPSFKDQIYDIRKESKKERPDDIVQCTGNEYSLNYTQYDGLTLAQKRKESGRLVNSNYKFYGYEQFGNELMADIGWDGKMHSLTDSQKKAIRTKFNNRVLVIDEIHNIKSDAGNIELRKVPPILQAIIRYGENIKLILMSATPMYDNAGEIIYILNLLLENDGRDPVRRNEIFDSNDNLVPGGAERLKELSKGYISYLRGENPVVFPLKIDPPEAFTPKIKYDIYGKVIPEDERLKYLKLYMCPMSKYQYQEYEKKLTSKEEIEETNMVVNQNNEEINKEENGEGKKANDEEQFANSILRPLSNIVLPNKNGEFTLPKKDFGYQTMDNGMGAFVLDMGYGRIAPTGVNDEAKKVRRKTYQFRYQSHVRFDMGTANEAPFLDEKHLKKYSCKFFEALKNIKGGKGICYVYSEFVWGGVLPFAMMLEQNGFQRYPWSGERPLLEYPRKRNPICAICGQGAGAKVHDNKKDPEYHEFKTARYILVTGDANVSLIETGNLLNIINNDNNKNGEEVKVIIGTRTTGEGLDFRRIRQVHVLEPWFNLSRIDQITGRGSRYCSHADLPKLEQNVEVFLYAVEPPEGSKKLLMETETIDTRIYRMAEMKDRKIKAVSYVLKQAAVDCALNKNGNIFDFEGKTVEMVSSTGRRIRISLGDKNGSRECDYRECYYQCVWEPDPKKRKMINTDTYNERFARTDMRKCKEIVKRLFKYGYVYELDDLVRAVTSRLKNLELKYIYIAISEMLNKVDEPVYDMYDRRGYLVIYGPYYIYQPMEFNYLKAPMKYRMVPFEEKSIKYMFEGDLGENEEFNLFAPKEREHISSKDFLADLFKRAEEISGMIDSESRNKMYIIITMLVDELSDRDKSDLIKKIILDYYETKGKMSNPYFALLFRYFQPLFLYKYRDLELGKGTGENDKLIGYFYVFSNARDEDDVGAKSNIKIFCYNSETKLITECPSETRDRIKFNMRIKMAKEAKTKVKNFNIIYGYMSLKDGPYVFKIFNGTKDTGAVTLEMKKSKRSEVKGKQCSHHNLQELEEVARDLKVKIVDSQKKNICILLEYKLREYDLELLNGKRWFLNSIEGMKLNAGWTKKKE